MGEKLSEYSYEIKKNKERKIINIIIFFITIFIITNLLMTFVAFPVRQVSNSMTPDFCENSLVMVTPLMNKVERGDVVLMNNEDKNLSGFNKICSICIRFFTAQQFDPFNKNDFPGEQNKIRRIVGMPGDSIYMRDYVLYIKPQGQKHYLTEFEITDKTYNVTFYVAPGGWDSSIGVKGSFDEMTLGADEYFVLGDNRKSCDDSRLWGIVNSEDFKAKALFCYFPFKNLKLY